MRLVGFAHRTHNTRPNEYSFSTTSTQIDRRKRTFVRAYPKENASQLLCCCCCSSTRILMRLLSSDLAAAVDSPSMYDYLYDILRSEWSGFFYRTHNTRPNSYSPTTFIPFNRRKQMTCRITQHQITGISNGLVKRTARYPEKALEVDPRRERGEGRRPPSKARPRGLNRPMAARKERESGESGSISKAERSNVGDEKTTIESYHNKLFPEKQHHNKSPGPKKIEPPCLHAPAKIFQVRGRCARRWRETPRCAHRRTPGEARRARPSREAIEKSGAKPGKRLESGLNSTRNVRNRKRLLRSQASRNIVYRTTYRYITL